ncbi:MAG: carbon storage regulator [Planctomycetota bacterium]|nr:carbon storage regulator [Planctomycetota bacterium]
MLVLSRRIGESIIVGDNVVVTVSRIQGNQVRLYISAPREVSIRRSELPEKTDVDTAAIYKMLQVSDRVSSDRVNSDRASRVKRDEGVDVAPDTTNEPAENSRALHCERPVVPFLSRKATVTKRPPQG